MRQMQEYNGSLPIPSFKDDIKYHTKKLEAVRKPLICMYFLKEPLNKQKRFGSEKLDIGRLFDCYALF